MTAATSETSAAEPDAPPISREDVSFLSAGARCDAWLYRPAGTGPHPCVVMAHGLGGIRAAALPRFAARFARAGIAALVFDYRFHGTSEGEPRGLIDIGKQREDYRAAIAYARTLHGLDGERIALWGTSFSGGHVLSLAAEDAPIAAAVIQNPFVDGRSSVAATLRSAGRRRAALLVWQGVRDEFHRLLGRAPHRVQLAGHPGTVAMMTTPDALAGYESILPADPIGWEPAVPARLLLRIGSYRPALRAHRVRCPLLVAVCDRDRISPARPTVRVAERAQRGELRRYPIGHFELFSGHWFERGVDDQITFLRHNLLSPPDRDPRDPEQATMCADVPERDA